MLRNLKELLQFELELLDKLVSRQYKGILYNYRGQSKYWQVVEL